MSPLLLFLLYNLILMGIAHKKEVSKRWYLIIAAASFLVGPAGLVAAILAKRFSKYQGEEYARRVSAHKIAILKSKILRNEKLLEKSPLLSSILIGSKKNFELREQLYAARQAYVKAGGNIKELEQMLSGQKVTTTTQTPNANQEAQDINHTTRVNPISQDERRRLARNNYNQCNTTSRSQSTSQSINRQHHG